MFFRRKSVGGRNYLQIVESRRTDGAVRQHVVATLGRAEDWLEIGKLDQLLQSGARLSETALVLSAVRDGEVLAVDSRRIGAPLIFERLWRETGCQAVIETLLADRKFGDPVERAIFAMRYRELWKVEQIFRTTKAVLETRPIYHSSDAAIRGHVFCSFLALTLRKELDDRLQAAGLQLEWQDVIGDLDRLVQTTVDSEGRRFVLRNQAPGCAGAVFQAVRVALWPLFSRLDGEKPGEPRDPQAAKPRKRRLAPAAVVPREKPKRDPANPINKFHKHGVEVQSNRSAKRCWPIPSTARTSFSR